MAASDVTSLIADLAATCGVTLSAPQADLLARYAQLVEKWQRVTNLTGARDAESFVREQLVDGLAVVPHLDAATIIDIGSGNGVPGIVIAICRPQSDLVLLEPRARRARFLTQVKIELELDRVTVVRERIELFRTATASAALVARAVAPLPRLVGECADWLDAGSVLHVLQSKVDADASAALARAGYEISATALKVPAREARQLLSVRAISRPPGDCDPDGVVT